MPTRTPATAALDEREFGRLVASRAIGVAFQPIVDLENRQVVGYESLARGPVGSRLVDPTALFDVAYRAGRVAELDWVARAAAFRAGIDARLPEVVPILVNVEPVSLGTPCPVDLMPAFDAARGRLRVFLEVTERSLASDPAALLAAVARARSESIGVALDDVGADPASLAMMPLIRPDVIKLDLALVQGRATPAVARVVNAVLAEAERSGAAIVAEGIESDRHVEVARSMGATLGQGWLYGRPGPLPAHIPVPSAPILVRPASPSLGRTPFEIVAAQRRPGRVAKQFLLPMCLHLEYKGLDSAEPPVMLAAFQDARYFDAATRDRYITLAARGVLTAALARGMPPEPGPGIRGGDLAPDDPLAREWALIVVGPHFAAALVARDCGDTGPDSERRFDFVITHDRDLVVEAAQPLLTRLPPPAR